MMFLLVIHMVKIQVLKCLACSGASKSPNSADSYISPREESRGGAGGGSGSRSKSNLVTVESLIKEKVIHQKQLSKICILNNLKCKQTIFKSNQNTNFIILFGKK